MKLKDQHKTMKNILQHLLKAKCIGLEIFGGFKGPQDIKLIEKNAKKLPARFLVAIHSHKRKSLQRQNKQEKTPR